MDRLFTVGAFGYTADEFVAVLREAGVDAVIDVRLRRGMRGREYAWANVARLEERLAREHIRYEPMKELAPSREIRAVQHAADADTNTAKRARDALSLEFAEAYERAILRPLDPADTAERISNAGPNAALFCVEASPAACHRSLIAGWLRREGAVSSVVHLGR